MWKYRIFSIFAFISVALLGWFYLVKPEITANQMTESQKKENLFKLGLDLVGGSQLTYEADISKLDPRDVSNSMEALKETLNYRLNPFGTSEVSIVVEDSSVFAENSEKTKRVIIQIPGESDPEEAKKKIGKIPLMEFKIESSALQPGDEKAGNNITIWENTSLTGANVKKAVSTLDPQTSEPVVYLTFDEKGKKLFADLTKNNIGKKLGIFLDGRNISDPVIRDSIPNGTTVISFGSISLKEKQKEADELAKNLMFGALPVPIHPVSSNVISPTFGKDILEKGLMAGFYGLLVVMLFLILVYRVAGFLASIALISYVVLTLSIFKFFGFVFTAAGIAGFIVSIGMAVDANVLIFEMVKDEFRKGSGILDGINKGFLRAWLSIRDGNISSILTAIILFYMTTALVKGFALTFGFGVITSMLSAIFLTRTFLLSVVWGKNTDRRKKVLFGNFKK